MKKMIHPGIRLVKGMGRGRAKNSPRIIISRPFKILKKGERTKRVSLLRKKGFIFFITHRVFVIIFFISD